MIKLMLILILFLNFQLSLLKQNQYGLFLIEGHRGFGNLEHHNTLVSYQKCIEAGLDSIELDVWLTTDKQLIILHGGEKGNPQIDLDGKEYNIYDLDSQTIRNQYKPYGEGYQIPLLEEVFEICRDKIRINIELKGDKQQPQLIDYVIKSIENNKMQDQILISSFDHQYYLRMIELKKNGTIPRIYPYNFLFNGITDIPEIYESKCIDFSLVQQGQNGITFPAHKLDDPAFLKIIQEAKEYGLSINAYFSTLYLEKKEDYAKLIEIGCSTLIVNEPLMAIEFRNQHLENNLNEL